MAMSVEQANRKLAKILEKLNEAIDERDQLNAQTELSKLTGLNQKANGQLYSDIADKLKMLSRSIIDEINEGGLEAGEVSDLVQIRNAIQKTAEPFSKTQSVIAALQNKGMTSQDLINLQQAQIDSNNRELVAIEDTLKEGAKQKIGMETECIDEINANSRREKILGEIKKLKANWNALSSDPTLAPAKEKAKDDINKKIQELSNEGVDVSSILDWENSPATLDTYVTTTNFKADSEKLAQKYVQAHISEFPGFVDNSTTPPTWTKTPDEVLTAVQSKYNNLVKNNTKLQTKYNTKIAENRKMQETIDDIKLQEEQINMVEGKTDKQMIHDAMNDPDIQAQADSEVSTMFTDTKNPFKRIAQKASYYRKYNGNNRVTAFFKAMLPSYNKLKRLATEETSRDLAMQSVTDTKQVASDAKTRQESDKQKFMDSIKQTVSKEMSNGAQSIDQDKVIQDALKDVIKSRSDDDGRGQ